jgi:sugar lactone lactonase YvrE
VIATADGTRIASVGPRTSLGALDQPTDVAVDAEGRIYVALPELGRLAIVDDRGRDLGGWDIPRGDTVEGPHLALTSEGAIVVSEPSARRVRIFDAGARELGRIDADLRSPFGVAVAGTRLYVTDPSAGRLLAYELAGP